MARRFVVGDTVTIRWAQWPERAGQKGTVLSQTPRGIVTVVLDDGTVTSAPSIAFDPTN